MNHPLSVLARFVLVNSIVSILLFIVPVASADPLNYEKVRFEKQGYYVGTNGNLKYKTPGETCDALAERAEYVDGQGNLVTFTAYPVEGDRYCEYYSSIDPTPRRTYLRFLCAWVENRANPKKPNWGTGGHDAEGCFCSNGGVFDEGIQWCVYQVDTGCPKENGQGNPCNVATGNKYQEEVDINSGMLTFRRSYNSQAPYDFGFGKGWLHSYSKRLLVSGFHVSYPLGRVLRKLSSRGKTESWTRYSSWRGSYTSDYRKLTDDGVEYRFEHKSGSVEYYDANGLLLREVTLLGKTTTYTYDQDLNLTTVTGPYGQSLSFAYLDGKLTQVTDTQGAIYKYGYDANDNLVEVIYPDTTPGTDSDNPRKKYFYEDTRFRNRLTGIEDENGDRYATWAYDKFGRAILSQHATTSNSVPQEKVELDFQWGE